MTAETGGAVEAGRTVEAGVIHDIGYQRYHGPRLGRRYAVLSLFAHGLRTAFGLGRAAKAKIFPWIAVGLITLVAIIVAALRTQVGEAVVSYWEFPSGIALLIIFFCATVAPELVSRDLRAGVLPLYFSRPITRSDYALAKLGAIACAVWLLLAGPQTLMFVAGVFSVDGTAAVWREVVEFGKGLAVSGVYALTFGSLALVVAALTGRRAVAAALVVALFLITTPVYGVLVAVAYSSSPSGELVGQAETIAALAGLVSPMTLVSGVGGWWFDPDAAVGPYGWLYGLVTLALVTVSGLALLLRYRAVAR